MLHVIQNFMMIWIYIYVSIASAFVSSLAIYLFSVFAA